MTDANDKIAAKRALRSSAPLCGRVETMAVFKKQGKLVHGEHQLDELKLVYRVLHSGIARHPELMDSDFLIDLQGFLQRQAQADGVDVTDHGAWEDWLGVPTGQGCKLRIVDERGVQR